MSTRPIVAASPEALQIVTFDATMEARIAELLPRYPTRRAAILPVLWLCQERFGWISPGVVRAVAARLGESPAFVEGVVSFYTMYQTAPPARYVLQVLHHALLRLVRRPRAGRPPQGAARDLLRREDAGRRVPARRACSAWAPAAQAPVIQINDDYYENLDVAKLDAILDELAGRS